MCLDTVTQRYENPDTRPAGTFWKFFERGCTGIWFPFRSDIEVVFDEWLQAHPVEVLSKNGPYVSGFHGYVTQSDALAWQNGGWSWYASLVLREVKYRGATVKGLQDGCEVIVAQEILIPDSGSNSLDSGSPA